MKIFVIRATISAGSGWKASIFLVQPENMLNRRTGCPSLSKGHNMEYVCTSTEILLLHFICALIIIDEYCKSVIFQFISSLVNNKCFFWSPNVHNSFRLFRKFFREFVTNMHTSVGLYLGNAFRNKKINSEILGKRARHHCPLLWHILNQNIFWMKF